MSDGKAKFILATNHSKLIKVRDAFITEGSINTLRCKFEFRTSDWNNTTKTAMFVGGRAMPSTPTEEIKPMLLDENNECDVPPEVLVNGTFSVGVFGVREDYRIVSNWMYYRIADGCFAEGSAPLEPTPTIYEQILNYLEHQGVVEHNHNELYYTKDEINKITNGLPNNGDSGDGHHTCVQSDWNQTDESADDYIKNKPDLTVFMQKPIYITLSADKWVQADDMRYYQVVTVENATITANSKVDLQPSSEQLVVFYEKDLAFVAENEDGVVSVFCVGQVPTHDYTIQATVTEVVVNG